MEKEIKTFNIVNESTNSEEIKELSFSIVDSLINHYKLKYLIEWERDHNNKPFQEELDILRKSKINLLSYLNNLDTGRITVDIKIEN